jgi:hypothetical protein
MASGGSGQSAAVAYDLKKHFERKVQILLLVVHFFRIFVTFCYEGEKIEPVVIIINKFKQVNVFCNSKSDNFCEKVVFLYVLDYTILDFLSVNVML